MGDFAELAAVSVGAISGPAEGSILCLAAVRNGRLRLSRADESVLLDVGLDRIDSVAGVGRSAVCFAVDRSTLTVDFATKRRAGRRFAAALTGSANLSPPQIAPPALGSRTAPASRGASGRPPDAGIFVSHTRSPRISGHFRRLVEETDGLIDWRFALNPREGAGPAAPLGCPEVLQGRHRQLEHHGGVLGGFLDVALIPRVLALGARHVWVMEYDVDYAGRWSELFTQFADNDCDVLTSTLAHKSDTQGWAHWPFASAPAWVQERHFHRAFHPLMRLSYTFALTYAVMVADTGWQGHCEFTIPTAAAASNATMEDLGGDGPFTPPDRRRRNYVNTPSDRGLAPGTFVWRPARNDYFYEQPDAFREANKLYHPVKPGVAAWERGKGLSEPIPAASGAQRGSSDRH